MTSSVICHRPWGYYETLIKELNYQVKRISVYPGKRISLQYHNFRSEHWVIVNGSGLVTLGDQIIPVVKDQSVYVEIKQLHRIENTSDNLLVFIETQVGEYLEEDDIVRIEDDYNRV